MATYKLSKGDHATVPHELDCLIVLKLKLAENVIVRPKLSIEPVTVTMRKLLVGTLIDWLTSGAGLPSVGTDEEVANLSTPRATSATSQKIGISTKDRFVGGTYEGR